MRALRVLRDVERRERRRALGVNPYCERMSGAAARATAMDAEILAMPEDTSDYQAVQAADGTLYFALGISALGGSDPLA
jgi:hypothetical protein